MPPLTSFDLPGVAIFNIIDRISEPDLSCISASWGGRATYIACLLAVRNCNRWTKLRLITNTTIGRLRLRAII